MSSLFFYIVLQILGPSQASACAACGCSLSSDWQNLSEKSFQLDVRYDFINQVQLRSGTNSIAPATAATGVNGGGNQEVESYTKNQYITATAEYSFNSSWKVSVLVPTIVRDHGTLGTASNGESSAPGGGQYHSSTTGLGDTKLIGRFQGFTPEHDLGMIFGLKFPTGSHTQTGSSSDPQNPGPAAIDRGLQPGTGTTDAILGVYYNLALNKNWDFFSEGLYQAALNNVDQYRPGDGYNLTVGTRYVGWESVTPLLQINGRFVENESGAQSDQWNTGGVVIYLSPGVTVPVIASFDVYGFVQVPLYQNLQGVQLAPYYTASLGARYFF